MTGFDQFEGPLQAVLAGMSTLCNLLFIEPRCREIGDDLSGFCENTDAKRKTEAQKSKKRAHDAAAAEAEAGSAAGEDVDDGDDDDGNG